MSETMDLRDSAGRWRGPASFERSRILPRQGRRPAPRSRSGQPPARGGGRRLSVAPRRRPEYPVLRHGAGPRRGGPRDGAGPGHRARAGRPDPLQGAQRRGGHQRSPRQAARAAWGGRDPALDRGAAAAGARGDPVAASGGPRAAPRRAARGWPAARPRRARPAAPAAAHGRGPAPRCCPPSRTRTSLTPGSARLLAALRRRARATPRRRSWPSLAGRGRARRSLAAPAPGGARAGRMPAPQIHEFRRALRDPAAPAELAASPRPSPEAQAAGDPTLPGSRPSCTSPCMQAARPWQSSRASRARDPGPDPGTPTQPQRGDGTRHGRRTEAGGAATS